VGHTRAVADREASTTGDQKDAAPAEQPQQTTGATELRAQVPAEIRDVSFPLSVRGYDRRAVDVYISRVNRVIAELEVSRSPQSAVRHALDRLAEQTKTILQQARESAEKITAAAREEGDEIVAGAKAEAANLIVNVSAEADRLRAEAEQVLASARAEADELLTRSKTEAEQIVARSHAEAAEHRRRSEEEIAALQSEAGARMAELQADTDAVRRQRHELLADIRRAAAQLQELAGAAASRFAPPESAPEDATKNDLAPVDSA
jgi:DivIVA domain-containing protein